ncbi:hypothetical protein [Gehongia tenuis]|uniref:hypothetical protein n=1 Tax=Gehongia tenuis TaxID=2763655 RepID=UPI0038B3F433
MAVARAIVKDAPIVILDEATLGYEGMDRIYRLQDGKLFEISWDDARAETARAYGR